MIIKIRRLRASGRLLIIIWLGIFATVVLISSQIVRVSQERNSRAALPACIELNQPCNTTSTSLLCCSGYSCVPGGVPAGGSNNGMCRPNTNPLYAQIDAIPASGPAPLSYVLRGTVWGSATGPITYTFDCNAESGGTADFTYTNITATTKISGTCIGSTAGKFSAILKVSRGGYSTQASTFVTVGQSAVTSTPAPSSCGGVTCPVGEVCQLGLCVPPGTTVIPTKPPVGCVSARGICSPGANLCCSGLQCTQNPAGSYWCTPQSSTSTPTPTKTPQQKCTNQGGVWETFPNSCADSCAKVSNPSLNCLAALTSSCDCGASKCWDGNRCVQNPPKLTPTKPPTKTPTPGSCAGVSCPVGEVCKNGACVNSCSGVTCPGGEVCQLGICVPPGVTVTPSKTPTPGSGSTVLAIPVRLHGIGKGGDNVNPSGAGNMNPLRPERQITIELTGVNSQVFTVEGAIVYDAGIFYGAIDAGAVPNGAYTVRVISPQYLGKILPGITTILANKPNKLPEASLTTGDTNPDNKLNILDYSLILDCFSGIAGPKNCDANKKDMTDLTDDGNVNQFDYNLFLRELSVQSGQ